VPSGVCGRARIVGTGGWVRPTGRSAGRISGTWRLSRIDGGVVGGQSRQGLGGLALVWRAGSGCAVLECRMAEESSLRVKETARRVLGMIGSPECLCTTRGLAVGFWRDRCGFTATSGIGRAGWVQCERGPGERAERVVLAVEHAVEFVAGWRGEGRCPDGEERMAGIGTALACRCVLDERAGQSADVASEVGVLRVRWAGCCGSDRKVCADSGGNLRTWGVDRGWVGEGNRPSRVRSRSLGGG